MAKAEFGVRDAALSASEVDGGPSSQAGGHPFALTTTVMFNTVGTGARDIPDGELKELRVDLPPGLVGTAPQLPQCGRARYAEVRCRTSTALGIIDILTGLSTSEGELRALVQSPVYNLEPLDGSGSELGMYFKDPPDRIIPLTIQLGVKASGPTHVLSA